MMALFGDNHSCVWAVPCTVCHRSNLHTLDKLLLVVEIAVSSLSGKCPGANGRWRPWLESSRRSTSFFLAGDGIYSSSAISHCMPSMQTEHPHQVGTTLTSQRPTLHQMVLPGHPNSPVDQTPPHHPVPASSRTSRRPHILHPRQPRRRQQMARDRLLQRRRRTHALHRGARQPPPQTSHPLPAV